MIEPIYGPFVFRVMKNLAASELEENKFVSSKRN